MATQRETFGSFPYRKIFITACIGGLSLFLYWEVLISLVDKWINVPAYSHGFFVPLVSLWIIWEYRHKLYSHKIKPNVYLGLIVVLFACFILVFGKASMVNILQQASLLIMVCGMILLFFGNRYMLILAMPVAYLILMFPFLDGFFRQIQWPFQLLSARMAIVILQQFNIPALLADNYIILPSITLEVARACSGIQYMVSIVAIVIPLMLLFLSGIWARLLLVLIALLIGFAVNWLRVVFIALWVYHGGDNLHGPGHIFQGLFISIFGFLVLFATAWGLGKLTTKSVSANIRAVREEHSYTGNELRTIARSRYLALFILLAVVGYTLYLSVVPVSLANSLSELPESIGQWHHETISQSGPVIFEQRYADDALLRWYQNPEGDRVALFIGYYESQHQGKELVHSDLQELYDVSKSVRVDVASEGLIPVYHAHLKSKGQAVNIIYWYDINGSALGNNILAKIYSAFDLMLNKQSNGAFIAVYAPASENKEHVDQATILEDFVRESFPVIRSFLLEGTKRSSAIGMPYPFLSIAGNDMLNSRHSRDEK